MSKTIFDNVDKAREWFRNHKPIPKDFDTSKFLYQNLVKNPGLLKDLKIADWILFQHVNKTGISRPILAVFVKFTIWDQALVIQFVESERAWTRSQEAWTSREKVYNQTISEFDGEVQSVQFWTDDINVLGYWKNKPTFSQLKQAIKNG